MNWNFEDEINITETICILRIGISNVFLCCQDALNNWQVSKYGSRTAESIHAYSKQHFNPKSNRNTCIAKKILKISYFTIKRAKEHNKIACRSI